MKTRLAITISAFAFQSATAFAGPSSYVCSIEGFQVAPGPNAESLEWVGELATQTTVAIDRATGLVIHPVIGNTGFVQVTLMHRGSDTTSFRSIADSGSGGNARYYEVLEFTEGSEKPFVAIAEGIAYWGSCQ